MRAILDLFRLDLEDMDLARAQFHSFSRQIPLLYLILVCDSAAIVAGSLRSGEFWRHVPVPLLIGVVMLVRARWWWRSKGAVDNFSDRAVVDAIRRICLLTVLVPVIFSLWCMALYITGDRAAHGHLAFVMGLSLVSMVFCAMALRAAAMRIAAIGTLGCVVWFGLFAPGMAIEASVLAVAGLGMMVVVQRHNRDFAELIRSQRDLRTRQSETEKLSEENRHIALTDALSGLPNRRALLDRLDRIEAAGPAGADTLAVVFIDLDGFKDINDAHGHQAGDTLIRSLAARLGALCPAEATLARVGGDEFVVLVETPDAAAIAGRLARAMNEEVCLPALVDRHVLRVGASVGVAGNDDELVPAHELLRRADMAMYHVKIRGKGRIANYTHAFDVGRLRRLAIEDEIARGLLNEEFDVVYQPVVDAADGTVIGAEALIRWPRRPGGELLPDEFIGIAEATGQILPLGLFVLDRATRDLRSAGDIKLSVNVSPAQFGDPGFERQVASVLRATRFPPGRLQFEITENYLLTDPERAVRAIDGFKALGMSIALDDFGTGFTSIHYLRAYGFSHIKIDKSLLNGLKPASKPELVIKGVISLAVGLDLRVIAEGVESEEQAVILRGAGCHKLQGFLFGRPMPIEQFVAHCGLDAGQPPLLRRAG